MFGRARSLRTDRTLVRARSLCSDRAGQALGRYVATELWLELGRYELGRYVATEIWLEFGCYIATEIWLELGHYVPGNGAKFDITQITLRSDLYFLK